MKEKIMLGIFIGLIILSIILNGITIKKLNEIEDLGLLIKENPKVCYMPRDCFETEKEYLNQFPENKEPKMFPECLIKCLK